MDDAELEKVLSEKRKHKPKKKGGWQMQVLAISAVLVGVMFLPISMILLLGMLPTPMAGLTEKTSRKGTKMVCVGAMNFAGCSPFIFELISKGISFDTAFSIISNPIAIIVIYSAAALGYLIDWAMTGIVANVMYEKGRKRQEQIKKTQEDLIKRWGPEVSGEKALDEYGFVLE